MEQKNDIDVPQALRDELKAAESRVPVITARVDRDILAMAAAQFEQRRPALWRSRPAWAAAAAIALIAVFVVNTIERPARLETAVYADVDNSGRVDIADVLALARSAKETGTLSQAEIDAFAMQIVSLNPVGDAS